MNRLPLWILALSLIPLPPVTATDSLDIREVTVFKNGLSLFHFEGSVAVDDEGLATVGPLPEPIYGTFSSYSATPDVRIRQVTTAPRTLRKSVPAAGLAEFMIANIGAEITVYEELSDQGTHPPPSYEALLIGVPQPEDPHVAILRTELGDKILPIETIRSIMVKGQAQTEYSVDRSEELMTWRFEGTGGPMRVKAGMMYVGRGLRWAPSYHIDLDGTGKARVRLRATLMNEGPALRDVHLNLVVGVPDFPFADMVDPLASPELRAEIARVLPQAAPNVNRFSNVLVTQVHAHASLGHGTQASNTSGGRATSPVPGNDDGEDLHVFELRHFSLEKGARAMVDIFQTELNYRDLYLLDMPLKPPPEASRYRSHNGREATGTVAPAVTHNIRLHNDSDVPLTTAPATVYLDGAIQAQTLVTFTPKQGSVNLELTKAVAILSQNEERETNRTVDQRRWRNQQYTEIHMTGRLDIANYTGKEVELWVTREFMGQGRSVGQDGRWHMLALMDVRNRGAAIGVSGWWYSFAWPAWWYHFNGIGQFEWKFRLEPGKSKALEYGYDYTWE
ncbi:hypothetical protein SCOR_00605 [Sulfidibacter corallicola]|uniref:DUF4139 domain-containing protein n=1 Tax=Sulfidibacter corallicola TaxID=2818388 RepID=A0A8A4TH67_SULCO|nr:hypothetical protein [Sulfidibacter corallicola]QTD48973.1 hypothetical protein J3U87_25595 [Sulfidibacter corallicola]